MKCNQFEEGEIPYGALEKFGLSHEMIEDLPMHVLEDIWNGRQSPVLPIHVTDDEGNHDYVVEDEYTEELWNEQKKSAQRNASLRK